MFLPSFSLSFFFLFFIFTIFLFKRIVTYTLEFNNKTGSNITLRNANNQIYQTHQVCWENCLFVITYLRNHRHQVRFQVQLNCLPQMFCRQKSLNNFTHSLPIPLFHIRLALIYYYLTLILIKCFILWF